MQVTLDIDVQGSRDLKTLVVDVAKNFGAHHVVLERCVAYFFVNVSTYARQCLECFFTVGNQFSII